MNIKQISKLVAGDKIKHNQLGTCTVIGILYDSQGDIFGVKLCPCFWRYRLLLSSWSGMHPNVPMLETTYRLIKPYAI